MDDESGCSNVNKIARIFEGLKGANGVTTSNEAAVSVTDPNRGKIIKESLSRRIHETAGRLNRSATNPSPPPIPPRPRPRRAAGGIDDPQPSKGHDYEHANSSEIPVHQNDSEVPVVQTSENTAETRVQQLQAEVQQVKSRVEALEVENQEYREVINRLYQERDKLLEDQQQQLTQVNQISSDRVIRLNERIASLDSELKDAEDTVKSLRQQLKESHEREEELERELRNVRRQAEQQLFDSEARRREAEQQLQDIQAEDATVYAPSNMVNQPARQQFDNEPTPGYRLPQIIIRRDEADIVRMQQQENTNIQLQRHIGRLEQDIATMNRYISQTESVSNSPQQRIAEPRGKRSSRRGRAVVRRSDGTLYVK